MIGDAILWGDTGQAKVVRPIIEANGFRVIRVFDNNEKIRATFDNVPMGGNWTAFLDWWRQRPLGGISFVVCIGGAHGEARVEISRALIRCGLMALTVVHHRAWIADSVSMGRGCQVLAMAAVCEGAFLGEGCIINTNATVDHDCHLGAGVHVMPGATIAGEVTIGDFATIGSNATVLPRLRIWHGAIIGAGAVVTKDVPPGETVVGCPARAIKKPRPKPGL